MCCKTNDLAAAMEAYNKAVAGGIHIEAQSFYNLLNLCDGLGDKSIHVGTPKTNSATLPVERKQEESTPLCVGAVNLEARQRYAFCIKKHMDKLQIPLTETAYTALVKVLSKTQQFEEAEKLLKEAESVQQCRPKIRMYSPLLIAYCDIPVSNALAKALSVWCSATHQNLALTEKEYAALIRCCVKHGDAAVMERVLTDLSEDVLIPCKETTSTIMQWFRSSFSSTGPNTSPKYKDPSSSTKTLLPPRQDTEAISMGPVQCPNKDGWDISEVCSVDLSTGDIQTGCLRGCSLKPICLSEKAWEELKQMNLTIALNGKLENDQSEFQGGKKGRKRKVSAMTQEERKSHWEYFEKYLAKRRQKDNRTIDVVIDGANVGYFEQNFHNAPKHVNYNQIDCVVKHFMQLNKNVLLIMHSRHFFAVPLKFKALVRAWEKSGVLYKTPPRMNDDWFWLHAALDSGPGTLMMTNDELRDHHFQMLSPRSFVRWQDRHQVRFQFEACKNQDRGASKDGREIRLAYPDAYSRRIQRVLDGLVVPLPKRGDKDRFLDGSHVADENVPKEETYVCIRPKPK